MAPSQEERTERVATNVTPETKRTVRVEAAKQDLTMAEYVRQVIEKDLQEA